MAARAQYLGCGQDGTAVTLVISDGAGEYWVGLDDGPPWRGCMVFNPAAEPAGPIGVNQEDAIIRFVRYTGNPKWTADQARQVWRRWERRAVGMSAGWT
jgi:hypothetical protein